VRDDNGVKISEVDGSDRERERQRDRETEGQRDRDTERQREVKYIT
jgi:hypothetical protein